MRVCSPRNSGRCQATLRFAFAVVALLGWGSATIAQTGLGTTVSFESASSWWGENAGSATIRVQLSAPVATTVTVSYATSNGTATSSQDYLSTTGTVQFAPGETVREITIPILSDTTVEPTEDLQITLSNPSLGVTLGIHNTHTVNILDDDVESRLSLSATPTAVCAGAKSTTAHQATVTATVTDGSGAPQVGASVTFSTTSGSLNPSSVTTDASGQATATLTSGTLASEVPDMHNATVTATASTGATNSTTIEVQPPSALLSVATSSIETTQQSALTFNLSWNSAPVPQHTVSYRISRIWDGTNNLIYDGTGTLPSGYGSLQVGSSQTNSSGDATVTFSAGSNPGLIEIEGSDTDVELMISGGHPKACAYVMVLLPGAQPETKVVIDNKSRGGDKVVVAKDVANGIPGGTKVFEVSVVPKGATATLIAARTGAGSTAGSAVFNNGTNELGVTGGDKPLTVTIEGRDTSDKPQNMEIQYKIGNNVTSSGVKFTVFKVELAAFYGVNETSADKIPASAKGEAGAGPETCRAIFDANKNNHKFGFSDFAGGTAQGGIYFRGKILPAGMNPADFGTGRPNGFDGKRVISHRWYKNDSLADRNVIAGAVTAVKHRYVSNQSDDPDDYEEDLKPDADFMGDTHLYIHLLDTPQRTLSSAIKANETTRFRFNATEFAEYGRTRCSNEIKWHFVCSGKKDQNGLYAVLADVANDNEVGVGHVQLTPNLGAPAGMAPAGVALSKPAPPAVGQPSVITAGDRGVAVEITGTNLKAATGAAQVTFLLDEVTGTADTPHLLEVRFPDVNEAGTKITGTLDVPADTKKGKYKMLVFKDGHPAVEVANALEIK